MVSQPLLILVIHHMWGLHKKCREKMGKRFLLSRLNLLFFYPALHLPPIYTFFSYSLLLVFLLALFRIFVIPPSSFLRKLVFSNRLHLLNSFFQRFGGSIRSSVFHHNHFLPQFYVETILLNFFWFNVTKILNPYQFFDVSRTMFVSNACFP